MSNAGFRPGLVVGSGRDAHLAFMAALLAAPEGTPFEIGLTWDAENKWRVYQRFGEHIVAMPSDEARRLYRTYTKQARKPEWREIAEGMRDTWEMFNTLASEAFHKNGRGEVPPDGVQFMPSQGRA